MVNVGIVVEQEDRCSSVVIGILIDVDVSWNYCIVFVVVVVVVIKLRGKVMW